MGKLSHLKSTFRGAVIALAASGIATESVIADASKASHDGDVYKYFALLLSVFVVVCIIQAIFFLLCTIPLLPKGCFYVIELIGDFLCSAFAIIAASLTAKNCGTGILQECYATATRTPIWICLAMGIINCVVFVLTAIKK